MALRRAGSAEEIIVGDFLSEKGLSRHIWITISLKAYFEVDGYIVFFLAIVRYIFSTPYRQIEGTTR